MPEMPDDFMGRFNSARGNIDPQEILAVLQQVVPPAMVGDVLAIAMDPKVQAGLAAIQEAVESVQEISFDLVETLPTLVAQLKDSYQSAIEGAQSAVRGIDPARITALKSYAPQVATGLAKVALSRPEAAPMREKVAATLENTIGKSLGGQPGAATVAVALQAITLKDMDRSGYGKAGEALGMALDLILPDPYIAATETVIQAFATARGVEYEDELGRWQRDAASKTLLTGAVNRYAKAAGLDALPDAERLASTAKMVTTLGNLFAGVSGDWVKNGSSPAARTRAERNARTAVRAVTGVAEAAIKAQQGPTPPKPGKTTRAPRAPKGQGGLAA